MKIIFVKGYTLIEILIVIFIITIVTSVAMLSIGKNENRRMAFFVSELCQKLTLAEEQAILQREVLGLYIKKNRLYFARFQSDKKHKKESWVPLKSNLLSQSQVPTNMELYVSVPTEEQNKTDEEMTPQIIISTNGDLTPFEIYIGRKGEKPRYVIIGTADGNITNQAIV